MALIAKVPVHCFSMVLVRFKLLGRHLFLACSVGILAMSPLHCFIIVF